MNIEKISEYLKNNKGDDSDKYSEGGSDSESSDEDFDVFI